MARRYRHLLSNIASLGLAIAAGCTLTASSDASPDENWSSYGGPPGETHFSTLDQINRGTVGKLGLAWSIDLPVTLNSVATPLAVDGILYYTIGLSLVHAVDAATGKPLWSYDPKVGEVAGDSLKGGWGSRGLAYWNGKIYVGTMDGRLIAIGARTGKPVWSVKTTEKGDGRYITGAPRVFNGKVIIGHGGADFVPIRGYITTYDAETGKQLWRFHIVPGDPAKGFENKAMEMAAKTWTGKWWTFGGGGAVWNAMTYDPQFNRIYIGTGNGTPWNRKVRSPDGGDNLFLSSILALDADTGAYVWHYQINPGDTWDFNASMDMELATLTIGGRQRAVLMQAPKNGFFYVIDRETGKLISAEPIAKVTWATKVDLATGRPIETPEARYPDGDVTMWPGPGGAHNWQAMSFNPKTGLVYIPTTHLPGHYRDTSIDLKNWRFTEGYKWQFALNPPGGGNDSLPDWSPLGELQAWNPITQKRVWSVPMKSPNNGGTLTTAGDIVFQGTMEGNFVAYAAGTGEKLWSFDAGAGILSTPITYRVGATQYVALLTGSNLRNGALSAQFGWDYRTQQRRVLAFAIGGKKTLPPTRREKPTPVDDPSFAIDPQKQGQGQVIFNTHCLTCHGINAIAGGAAPDLRASEIPLSAEAFEYVVRQGPLVSLGMPKFDDLTPDEMEALRHYIRARARKALGTTR